MQTPKVTFVAIKDKQVQTASTIDGDTTAIFRRISVIQEEAFDKVVAIYGEGAKFDITFPLDEEQIQKVAERINRNLLD